VRIAPELVALSPSTPWTKSGTYRIVPNIAAPMKNSATWDAANVRFRERSSGRIGSRARRSHATNARRSAVLTAKRPMISDDAHGYCVPPHTVARRPVERPAVSSAAPV
jgi:hypothetical protein